jgi:hypothetical protein
MQASGSVGAAPAHGAVMTFSLKLFRNLAAALVGAAMFLALVACGEKPPAVNVAVIVGQYAHASPLLDGEGHAIPVIASALDPVLGGRGTLTVIADDGRPRAVHTIELQYDSRSPQLRQDALAANRRALEDALRAAGPIVSQAEPAAALKLGADAVRGKPNPAVFLFDPGLSTTGSVLMQLGLISFDTDAAGLARQSRGQLLGHLDGTNVHWYGLCSVVSPQPPCTAGLQQKLQEYYRGLITDAGGRVSFDDIPLAGGVAPTTARPTVDIVRWKVPRITTTASPPEPKTPPIIEVLTQDVVRFLPNSDRYADPATSAVAISGLATRLRADRYPTAEVVGCTAKDPGSTEAQMVRRARSRAAAIVRDLRAHGASTSFAVRGLGWRCPGYRAGADEANRRVIVSTEPVR